MVANRNYWLDLYTLRSWEEFVKAGAKVSGSREDVLDTINKIKKSDYLICYLIRIERFIGILEVISDPFTDDTIIWKYDTFPCRLKVNPILMLTPETAVPISELPVSDYLLENGSDPQTRIMSRYYPPLLEKSDAETIVSALSEAKTNPVRREYDKELLDGFAPKPSYSEILRKLGVLPEETELAKELGPFVDMVEPEEFDSVFDFERYKSEMEDWILHPEGPYSGEFYALKEYLVSLEKFIISEGEKIEEEEYYFERKLGKLPAHESEEYEYPVYQDADHRKIQIWKRDIPRNLRTSFIMLLISVAENKLQSICNYVEQISDAPISQGQLAGGIFQTFKKFLNAFGELKEPTDEEWNIIEGIYDVRNVLVHGGGFISKSKRGSKKKLNLLVNENAGIEIIDSDYVKVNSEFCKFALSNVWDFFVSLYKELKIRRKHEELKKNLEALRSVKHVDDDDDHD
jgi:hypothetical protein